MQSLPANSIIYGRHPVLEALEQGLPFQKILLQRGTRGEFEKELRRRCKEANIPLQYAPKERLSRWVRGNHQGVVGLLSPLPFARLEEQLPFLFEKGEAPLLLLLDGVTDVRNFGAIARTAEVFGVHALVLPSKGSVSLSEDAVKTSAGALTRLPVCRERNLQHAIDLLRLSGVRILASSLQAEKPLHEVDFRLPSAILIGSEDKGVHPALLTLADERFIIPQVGKTDSLNVSVATGIMLYEAMRQRRRRE